MDKKLTPADVQRLLEDPSADNRMDAAHKIAAGYDDGSLTNDERRIAEDIFKVMVRDVETRVREALSGNLKSCPFLPRDVARSLAEDVDSVALPVLQFSTVLTDDDLVEIVRDQGSAKLKAVAKRETVSETVSDALVDHGDADVVMTLVANEGAKIAEPSMQKVIEKHGDNIEVTDTMAGRTKLPVNIAERLVSLVSDTMRDHIVARHELPAEVISDLIVQAREKATLGLLSGDSSSADVRELVTQLYANGRLTPSIVLRAVCLGDMRFFEAAVAVLAKMPLIKARVQIHDAGNNGLGDILRQAKLPKPLLPAFQAAVEVSHETDYDGGENDRERFRRRMIERILTNFENPNAEIGDDNIDYLLAKLSQIDPDLARPI